MSDDREGLIAAMLGQVIGNNPAENMGVTVNIAFNGPTTVILRPDAADTDLVKLTTAIAANDG